MAESGPTFQPFSGYLNVRFREKQMFILGLSETDFGTSALRPKADIGLVLASLRYVLYRAFSLALTVQADMASNPNSRFKIMAKSRPASSDIAVYGGRTLAQRASSVEIASRRFCAGIGA